jgi:hypothetical protein
MSQGNAPLDFEGQLGLAILFMWLASMDLQSVGKERFL